LSLQDGIIILSMFLFFLIYKLFKFVLIFLLSFIRTIFLLSIAHNQHLRTFLNPYILACSGKFGHLYDIYCDVFQWTLLTCTCMHCSFQIICIYIFYHYLGLVLIPIVFKCEKIHKGKCMRNLATRMSFLADEQ
jgi:hypothetical protein